MNECERGVALVSARGTTSAQRAARTRRALHCAQIEIERKTDLEAAVSDEVVVESVLAAPFAAALLPVREVVGRQLARPVSARGASREHV